MTLMIGQAFEKLFGPDVPLRFTAYDGSSGGRPDADVHLHLANERGLRYVVTAPGSLGMARAYVQGDLVIEGVDEGNPYELLKMLEDEVAVQRPHARDAARAGEDAGLEGDPPAGAAGPGVPAAVAEARQRAAAHPHARRRGDPPPLRRVQRLLRAAARAVDDLHLRLLPHRGRQPRGGAGGQVRPGLPQARPAARDAAAGRRAAAGAGWSATPSRTTASRPSASPSRSSRRRGPARPSRRRG